MAENKKSEFSRFLENIDDSEDVKIMQTISSLLREKKVHEAEEQLDTMFYDDNKRKAYYYFVQYAVDNNKQLLFGRYFTMNSYKTNDMIAYVVMSNCMWALKMALEDYTDQKRIMIHTMRIKKEFKVNNDCTKYVDEL